MSALHKKMMCILRLKKDFFSFYLKIYTFCTSSRTNHTSSAYNHACVTNAFSPLIGCLCVTDKSIKTPSAALEESHFKCFQRHFKWKMPRAKISKQDKMRLIRAHENDEDFLALADQLSIKPFSIFESHRVRFFKLESKCKAKTLWTTRAGWNQCNWRRWNKSGTKTTNFEGCRPKCCDDNHPDDILYWWPLFVLFL